VVDTNIPEQSIQYVVELCNKVKVPLLIEPVSVKKAEKLRNVLSKIDYITPNMEELESLSGIKIDEEKDMVRAVESLKNKRVKNIVVTLGERGIYISSSKWSCYGGAHYFLKWSSE